MVSSEYCNTSNTNRKLIETKYKEMISADSPLTKGESKNHPQLSRSKLGKDLGRSIFAHAKAEHPWLHACMIGLLVLMIVFIGAFVHVFRNVKGDDLPRFLFLFTFLSLACLLALPSCLLLMVEPVPMKLIGETDDAFFFLKLIAAGHSLDEVGEIMNSYLFQRGIWWTNSYFYDGRMCYNFFVRYSKDCTDPAIQVFIEQAKSKLTESIAQQWDRIQLPDE